MGNETSNNKNNQESLEQAVPKICFSDDWTLVGSQHNDLYDDIRLFKNTKTKQMCALKSYLFQDRTSAFQHCLKQFQGSVVFDVPSLVKIIDIEQSEQKNICSNFQKLYVTFEYLDKTLENEILQRIIQKKAYTEEEIFKLVDCVLSALIFLNFRGKENLALSPVKILMNKNLYKLTDSVMLTGISDYQRLMIKAVDKKDWFVAPEVIHEIGKKKLKPNINTQKAEVFNLGMICLYLATFVHPQELKIYDFDNYKVDEEQLQEYITLFNQLQGYSGKYTLSQQFYKDQFKTFVLQLVVVDPSYRLNFKEVLEKIPQPNEKYKSTEKDLQSQRSSHNHLHQSIETPEKKQPEGKKLTKRSNSSKKNQQFQYPPQQNPFKEQKTNNWETGLRQKDQVKKSLFNESFKQEQSRFKGSSPTKPEQEYQSRTVQSPPRQEFPLQGRNKFSPARSSYRNGSVKYSIQRDTLKSGRASSNFSKSQNRPVTPSQNTSQQSFPKRNLYNLDTQQIATQRKSKQKQPSPQKDLPRWK